MAWNYERALNYTVFIALSVILFCLIILTPTDAIYQCYITQRLTNIFIITGGYVVTFLLAVLIYATRIYTNRTVLAGIPKAWIPVEKEDVGKSVRRLVVEGLARSAIVAYQARPRDIAADADTFDKYPMLQVDRHNPPWGAVEHPGWSSPSAPDLPDLPYRNVVHELPHLIEAKAVSLAPPDPLLTATAATDTTAQSIPDTRVVDVLRRPAEMGLREYLQHLASRLGVLQPPELGAEFLALYERARFSTHELHESEFGELMRVFADVLRGMKTLDPRIVEEIRGGGGGGGSTRADSESVIGPSDEEGETDTMDYYRGESDSLRPSRASSAWESRSTRSERSLRRGLAPPRTPSMRSLRPVRSNASGSSGGSVIRLVETERAGDLPYEIGR